MSDRATHLSIVPASAPAAPVPRGSALRRIAPLPELPPPRPSEPGLHCPYCRCRTTVPTGGLAYICNNPDCPGTGEEIFQFTSCLLVDAARGAYLIPWREAKRITQARIADPLAALRRNS